LINAQIGHHFDVSLPKDTPVKVFLTRREGCTEAIINEIDQAKAEFSMIVTHKEQGIGFP
jgi:hypothetical protein